MAENYVEKETGMNEVGRIPEGFVYRDQSKRYPWWVKSVDKITTQVDESIMEKPRGNVINWFARQPAEYRDEIAASGKANYSRRVQNNEPGARLQDVALHQAASSFWWAGAKMNGEIPQGSIMELVNLSRSKMCVSPDDFDVIPWEGTPEEASDMVEAAG
ncbi:MAG: hypothetical protein JRI95_01565, partial [Deltaproteobacteria bacterium]|nr:hypothetical protein [Deltaproteobacteria bacterium]